jgi:hypothetical protein
MLQQLLLDPSSLHPSSVVTLPANHAGRVVDRIGRDFVSHAEHLHLVGA